MDSYIEAHLTHLRAAGLSPRTIGDRAEVLARAHTQLPHGLLRATTPELEQWLANSGRAVRPDPDHSWSQATRCTYQFHLRAFFAWMCHGAQPMLSYNPMSEVSRPRQPRRIPNPVTDDELALVLGTPDPQWRLVVLLAAYAGLRSSEIARLRREDVTPDLITIRGGKGGKDEALPTHPEIWAAVQHMPAGALIHRKRDNRPADGAWLTRAARDWLDSLGLPKVHLHRFRHWCGTTVQRNGRDLRVTQEIMRHASPATTAGYAKVTDEQRRLALTALPIPATTQQAAA